MFTETITYVDFNDTERTETLYFNLSKAEILEMEMSVPGGYAKYLEDIVNSKDTVKIMETFIEIVKKTYGVKSEDGKRFIKSDEITKEFLETEAYSEFLMKLVSDEGYAATFVQGVLPKVDNIVELQKRNA